MKKILESSSIKADLRKKYASQLERNYALGINTEEGWNDSVRINHSNILIDKGIEPTEENLAIFQEEVNERVKELEKKYPSEPLPIVPVCSPIISVEEYSIELEALKLEKIFMNRSCAYPHKLLFRVYDRMFRKYGDAFGLSAVYLLGKIHGIQAERSKRRERAQAFNGPPLAM